MDLTSALIGHAITPLQMLPCPTSTCCVCGRHFSSVKAMKQHKQSNHNESLNIGDRVIARNVGDFSWSEGLLFSDSARTVLLPNSLTPVCFDQIRAYEAGKFDPTIFIKPVCMKPEKTQEEELEQEESDDEGSSITSEGGFSATSVDLTQDFPSLAVKQQSTKSILRREYLPLWVSFQRIRVRSSFESDSSEVAILESGEDFYVQDQFQNWATEEVAEWFDAKFPMKRSKIINNQGIDGQELASLRIDDLREALHISQSQAELVRKTVRGLIRKALIVFVRDGVSQSGWISLKKGNKMLAKRCFAGKPVLCINNIFTHSSFEYQKRREVASYKPFNGVRGIDREKDTFHALVENFQKANKKQISMKDTTERKDSYLNPSMDWYKQTLKQMLKQAGAAFESIEWHGIWTKNFEHGSELHDVIQFDARKNKNVRRSAIGYTMPESFCHVVFKSHSALQSFLELDLSAITVDGVKPLASVTVDLDADYANLCPVEF